MTNVAHKTVETIYHNNLIVEVTKKKYAKLLLKMTSLHNMKIKAYPHRSLKTFIEVMRSPELSACSLKERKLKPKRGCPRDVMVKVLDCGIIVSKFELWFHYYVYFQINTLGKGMNPLILIIMG